MMQWVNLGKGCLLALLAQEVFISASYAQLGQTAPPSPNLNNVFNAPPVGALTGNHDLVVTVHGYDSSPAVWAQPMLNDILGQVPNDTWDTWALDWSQDAKAGFPNLGPTTTQIINAQLQGQYLAHTILSGNYQEVHLLGHSLGGRVIQSAATVLSQAPNAPTIQTTFLDPYTPTSWNFVYGTNATWSDEIVNTSDYLNTNSYLPNSFDVDVTPAFTGSGLDAGHSWPYQWYDNTVNSYSATQQTYSGLGFGLSQEVGGANWPAGNPPRGTVDLLNRAGTGVASVFALNPTKVVNPLTLNPGGQAAVLAKSSDKVVLGDNLITMHTSNNMNEWVNLAFNPTAPTNFVDFKFDFSTQEDGTLSVWLDNSMIYAALDPFALTNTWEDSGLITFNTIAPGQHVLSYRLDAGPSDGGSTVGLMDINAGAIVVPEPAGAMLCVMAGAWVLGRRRRGLAAA